MIDEIDEILREINYRRSFHKDEAQEFLEPLGVTLDWHREYMTKAEFSDMLLDLRLEHMEANPLQQEEANDSVQEELDALVGADLNSG